MALHLAGIHCAFTFSPGKQRVVLVEVGLAPEKDQKSFPNSKKD